MFQDLRTSEILEEEDISWRDDAACKDYAVTSGSYDAFYSPDPEVQAETKKRFCSVCPVTAQCYNFAVTQRLDEGIYGGMNPDERKRMRFWMSGVLTKRSRLVQFEVDD